MRATRCSCRPVPPRASQGPRVRGRRRASSPPVPRSLPPLLSTLNAAAKATMAAPTPWRPLAQLAHRALASSSSTSTSSLSIAAPRLATTRSTARHLSTRASAPCSCAPSPAFKTALARFRSPATSSWSAAISAQVGSPRPLVRPSLPPQLHEPDETANRPGQAASALLERCLRAGLPTVSPVSHGSSTDPGSLDSRRALVRPSASCAHASPTPRAPAPSRPPPPPPHRLIPPPPSTRPRPRRPRRTRTRPRSASRAPLSGATCSGSPASSSASSSSAA